MESSVPTRFEPASRLAVLRNLDFVLLWSGQTISVLGNQVSTIALPLLVLALTGSAAQAGAVSAVRLIPYAALSFPAGALVDRWNRKVVMAVADTVRAVALGSIVVGFLLGHLSPALLYVAVLLEGGGLVFFTIAQIASLPRVVSGPQLVPATAMNEASLSIATLVGPGLGGVIIGLGRTIVSGAVIGLAVDAVSYLASVLSLLPIRARFQADRQRAPDASLREDVHAGLAFLLGHRQLRALALIGLTIGLFIIPADLAAIVLSRSRLGLGPQPIGLIFSAGGLGAVLGSAVGPWFRDRLRLVHVVCGTLAVEALAVALMAVTGSPVLLGVGMFVETAMLPVSNVSAIAYRLRAIPDELQGRVNGTFRLFPLASQPVGLAAAGLLLSAIGPRPVLGIIAGGLLLTALAVIPTRLRDA